MFDGGRTKFQPVYVGDIARLIEIISRNDPDVRKAVDGKIIEAGGPEGEWYVLLVPQYANALHSLYLSRNDVSGAEVFPALSTHHFSAVFIWDAPRDGDGEVA